MRCLKCGSPYMVGHSKECPLKVKGKGPNPKDYERGF